MVEVKYLLEEKEKFLEEKKMLLMVKGMVFVSLFVYQGMIC